MAETTNKKLSAQDIKTILKQQEIYLMSPEELISQHPELAETKNLVETHEKMFAELHEQSIANLQDFVAGKLDLTPDALEVMENFIATFADGYKAPEMKKLAADARQKLQELKQQNNEKAPAPKSQLEAEEAEFKRFLKNHGVTAEEFANFSEDSKGMWSKAFHNWQAKEIALKAKARQTSGITATENNEGIDVLAKKAEDKAKLAKALAAARKEKEFTDFLASQGKTIEDFDQFSDGGKGAWLTAFHNWKEQKGKNQTSQAQTKTETANRSDIATLVAALGQHAEETENTVDFGMVEEENSDNSFELGAVENTPEERTKAIPQERGEYAPPPAMPEKPKSFWGKVKDKARKWGKKLLWAAGIVGGLLLLNKNCSDKNNGETLPQPPTNTTITPPDTVKTQKPDPQDMYQIARRIAFQNKIDNPIEAATEAFNLLEKFSKLPKETIAAIPGESLSNKLVKVVVVRGDQHHLREAIDNLINGQRPDAATMDDIVKRAAKVTEDYGANEAYKEENRQVGRQTDPKVTKAMVEKIGQNRA